MFEHFVGLALKGLTHLLVTRYSVVQVEFQNKYNHIKFKKTASYRKQIYYKVRQKSLQSERISLNTKVGQVLHSNAKQQVLK